MIEHDHVVVGVDGTDDAIAAVKWAAQYASAVSAPLRIVHAVAVLDLFLGEALVMNARAIREERDERGREILRAAEDIVRQDHPGLRVTVSMPEGPVADILARASTTAHMLVLGCRRSGAVHDLVVGSDTIRITRRSHAPVLLHRAPHTERDLSQDPVIVGVDQSDNSARAAELALEMARVFKTRLVVTRFWQPPIGVGSAVGVIDWQALEDSESTALSEWVGRHLTDRAGVEVETACRMSNVAVGLRAMSAAAQMVVVGTRGRSVMAGLLLGSVSQNMIHHAECSVLVVP